MTNPIPPISPDTELARLIQWRGNEAWIGGVNVGKMMPYYAHGLGHGWSWEAIFNSKSHWDNYTFTDGSAREALEIDALSRLSAPPQADASGGGVRYFLLNPGDVIQEGDEYHSYGGWKNVPPSNFGVKMVRAAVVRRRAPNAVSVREAAQRLLEALGSRPDDESTERWVTAFNAMQDQPAHWDAMRAALSVLAAPCA